MAERTHKKRPRDPNQLGKMIVDISVGDVEDRAPTSEEQGKNQAAVNEDNSEELRGAASEPRIYPKLVASRLLARPLEPAGKPRLIVSSRKIIDLLASD